MTYDSDMADTYGAQFMNLYCTGDSLRCTGVTEREGEFVSIVMRYKDEYLFS